MRRGEGSGEAIAPGTKNAAAISRREIIIMAN